MDFELSPQQLRNIIREAARLGATIALTKTGKLQPYLKKRAAARLYGAGLVEQGLAKGRLTVRKDGNHSAAWRIDRIEIEAIVSAMEIWRNL